ncbi:tRNA dimethylallyltransferase [Nocardioides baekrokdamisoli]|uniref:tRNA dimethylallyltransferase n=1 Tax=Nocardioides baekrokdamisoli TaxID=1804624 RepID=A0A3G9IZT4_9ACTN|nr:tRNA (adenosine(37)-N6)-dimethylallyltransferase MiaA [Nocardioides baekrokdamisoli]BBH16878.1 tRNA dimethylallyltransferase [Nocardioides baekrokdamisoli]
MSGAENEGRTVNSPVPPIVAIVGATASGKTELSLGLAEALGGEIVNSDAMQFYRGMDIGTAKAPEAERRGIPHHMLDLLDITEPASVGDFQARARAVMAEVRGRGRVPILVGGSGLYNRALLDEFDFPATDAGVRARLEAALEADGSAALHWRLAHLDPAAAEVIKPENGRRIVRALEVIELTGEPFSARLPEQTYRDPRTIQIGVDIDRSTLAMRIGQRVDAMFDNGLIEEVRSLLEQGLEQSRTARMAIGYREAVCVLRGEMTDSEARERTASATRRFARRQDAWFRKDPRVVWVAYDDPDRVGNALAAVRTLGA